LIDSRLDLAESTNEMLGTYGAPAFRSNRVALMVGEGARKLVERARWTPRGSTRPSPKRWHGSSTSTAGGCSCIRGHAKTFRMRSRN
jgi:hypothetical protein